MMAGVHSAHGVGHLGHGKAVSQDGILRVWVIKQAELVHDLFKLDHPLLQNLLLKVETANRSPKQLDPISPQSGEWGCPCPEDHCQPHYDQGTRSPDH